MRSILITLLAFIGTLAYANEVNLSTITRQGTTVFFLQAGTFNLEKDALNRQKELTQQIREPVEIKNLSNQKLYLVQIGPIPDYASAKALKETLTQTASVKRTGLSKTLEQMAAVESNTPVSESTANQTLPEPGPEPLAESMPEPEKKLWNLRNADIRAVITEVSRVTGKNFIIDPRVQGKVSIVSATPLSQDALYQVFLSVLQVSGYSTIPDGNVIKIIPNIDAKTQVTSYTNEASAFPKGEEMMVSVIPVHYVPSEQLVPILRPLMPQWSAIGAYAPSNMIILSGYASHIQSISKIIKQVDSSSANGIDIVHLQHALAMDVANTLKDLVKTQPNSGMRTQITIAPDDRSNSILISGTKTDRIRLRMLIVRLDNESSNGLRTNTQVVYLNYLRAEDLVPILAGIAQANFSGTVGTTIGTITRPALDSTNPASSLSNNSTPGMVQGTQTSLGGPTPPPVTPSPAATANTSSAATQNEGSTKPTVQIIAEPNTNSVIINAPVSIIRVLKMVIAQLDIKPAQLLIEALIAEVNQDDITDLGIEWGSNQQTGNVNAFRPGFAIINSRSKISDFQAQIYALARDKKANILSTPSVVVLDNRQAKILVGKQVSVASTSYPNNAGGTTTASPFTTFERMNVALHLYVRPQITRGNGIQMQIDQGNDTIEPTAVNVINPSFNPTFQISSIVTSVHVESGDIIVLGGLTQDSIGNNDNRIPIIGDIPGLGKLFQRNINTREKRVLMVFIKPIILRTERDNLQVTGAKYNDARQYQLDWLKSQEIFDQTDNETVLPPLTMGDLPVPFTNPPIPAAPPPVVRRGPFKALHRPWK